MGLCGYTRALLAFKSNAERPTGEGAPLPGAAGPNHPYSTRNVPGYSVKCITHTRRSRGVTMSTQIGWAAPSPPTPRLSSRRTPLPKRGPHFLSRHMRSLAGRRAVSCQRNV